jgi:hypothetical protein
MKREEQLLMKEMRKRVRRWNRWKKTIRRKDEEQGR